MEKIKTFVKDNASVIVVSVLATLALTQIKNTVVSNES